MPGPTLILLAALIVWTARVARPIGICWALSEVSYVVGAWIISVGAFAPEADSPVLIGEFSPPICRFVFTFG